jgi:hypothetical protein
MEPYSHPEQLKTHFTFWNQKGRLLLGMQLANGLTDGRCLATPDRANHVCYRENASSIRLDLGGISGPQRAIAVDTRLAYEEIDLGTLKPVDQTLDLGRASDWAIAVGPIAHGIAY